MIGNPAPGIELKLVPSGETHEIRVRGPNVTPGYYGAPDLTREAFDEDGFYRIGDAMKLADPDDPASGLVFDGRVAEDFKLQSGSASRRRARRDCCVNGTFTPEARRSRVTGALRPRAASPRQSEA